MGEDGRPQVGYDALAQRDDEVVAERARQRESSDDHDQHAEICVDHIPARLREPVVDYAANGDRHGQGRHGGGEQRSECGRDPPLVGERVRDQRLERA
jgi:hypothetical protein